MRILQMQAPAPAQSLPVVAEPASSSTPPTSLSVIGLSAIGWTVVRPARLVVALGLILLAAVPVRAQEPEQRAELERFRDSLAGTVDSVGLLALERRMIERAKADRNNAMIHLRLRLPHPR